jgi:hypothetical protein
MFSEKHRLPLYGMRRGLGVEYQTRTDHENNKAGG